MKEIPLNKVPDSKIINTISEKNITDLMKIGMEELLKRQKELVSTHLEPIYLERTSEIAQLKSENNQKTKAEILSLQRDVFIRYSNKIDEVSQKSGLYEIQKAILNIYQHNVEWSKNMSHGDDLSTSPFNDKYVDTPLFLVRKSNGTSHNQENGIETIKYRLNIEAVLDNPLATMLHHDRKNDLFLALFNKATHSWDWYESVFDLVSSEEIESAEKVASLIPTNPNEELEFRMKRASQLKKTQASESIDKKRILYRAKMQYESDSRLSEYQSQDYIESKRNEIMGKWLAEYEVEKYNSYPIYEILQSPETVFVRIKNYGIAGTVRRWYPEKLKPGNGAGLWCWALPINQVEFFACDYPLEVLDIKLEEINEPIYAMRFTDLDRYICGGSTPPEAKIFNQKDHRTHYEVQEEEVTYQAYPWAPKIPLNEGEPIYKPVINCIAYALWTNIPKSSIVSHPFEMGSDQQ
jgi:hypothetical protein